VQIKNNVEVIQMITNDQALNKKLCSLSKQAM